MDKEKYEKKLWDLAMYGICEHCGKLIELERSNVGVGWVWHGYCCGWNQTPPPMPFEEAKNYSVQQRIYTRAKPTLKRHIIAER